MRRALLLISGLLVVVAAGLYIAATRGLTSTSMTSRLARRPR
jgi:hypothetical protein